jgi:3-hydroxymyristoyl/3-hydroxydecanoyl-(acyl carrier protein) dehydratase
MRFLFVDRIIHSIPGELIKGVKHVTRDDLYLTQSDEGRACFIPSLIGETLGQLAAWNVMAHNQFTLRPVAGVVDSARLFRPAFVGETILLESYIDSVDSTAVQYHSVATIGGEPVFVVDGALGPLLPMEGFIHVDEVKQQYTELYRPGDWDSLTNLSLIEDDNQTAVFERCPALMFDRILSLDVGESIVAEKRIARSAPYFPDHFPKKAVLPMTVLLECKINLARQFIAASAYSGHYQVNELRKIKMNEFVFPGDVVLTTARIKQQTDDELVLAYRSEVSGKRVCVVEIILSSTGR